MAKEFTRRQLYVLIWARPMTKVAAELGISDVGMNKFCRNQRVAGHQTWSSEVMNHFTRPRRAQVDLERPFATNLRQGRA